MSDYIFNDGNIKSRLIRKDKDWFVGEFKPSAGESQWFPWICGTAEFLGLTEQDIAWAKNA